MAYESLADFAHYLEKQGELKRITHPVDPHLEITEIADRVMKAGGPALLFEQPKGSRLPLIINTFGSRARMSAALGVDDLEEVAQRLETLVRIRPPESWGEKLGVLGRLIELSQTARPKRVPIGACKEIIERDDPSLDILPIQTCWPADGGPFITLPLVFTRHPITGRRNVGCYRMQKYDSRTTGMHWQLHKVGAEHGREAERLARERFPVAVALGGDPVLTYAATAPLPPEIDEIVFAGWIRRRAIEMVKCETNSLDVPADSDIVIEGYIDPAERRREGPFGDHTGYYSLADDYPVFHLTCVTHRMNPIYHTIIVGRPPMEDCHMAAAIERLFLPLMKKQLPEIVDFHMPFEGIFHNLVLVSIDKQYPGHARKVMHALWGLGQAMVSKVIVVMDRDVNVRDYSQVTWKVLNHIDPQRDIEFVLGPVETLDHASRLPKYGSKMGVDATRKWPEEGFTRPWPDEIVMDQPTRHLVDRRWKEYGLEWDR